ncbi:MAG TPA: CapA family protein [Phycisphaerae bacterium]|nr:CapA family protein [Phycisphaerae bacterium]
MILLGDWAPGSLHCDVSWPAGCALLNLEGPLLPAGHQLPPAPKAGPHLHTVAPPPPARPLVCALANNHIMDFGPAGLAETLSALLAAGIHAVGAGDTLDVARQPLFLDDAGTRVAILACCEAQFGVAVAAQPGVAAFGPWVYAAIRACAAQADAVIVSVHAGAEVSPWPAPAIQDLYRSWIDAGAAVVHGHHPHVPQGLEEYHDGLIFYGLGNLAVNPHEWQAYPNALWSLGVDIQLGRRPLQWRALEINLTASGERLAITARESAEHAAYLADCNRPLVDRKLLTALWQDVADRAYREYYRGYLGLPPERASGKPTAAPVTSLWRQMWCGARPSPRASRQDYLLWHHLFGCLTHRDLIATALGVLGGELPDLRSDASRRLVDQWLPWTQPFATAAGAPS